MRTIALLVLLVIPASASGQSGSAATPEPIPAGVTALEGSPTVRVDTTVEATTRRSLTNTESSEHGLSIRVADGRYFWASRSNEELTLRTADGFTYLTTTSPGRYVRLTRINDRVTYAEHVEIGTRSVTYFGELQIVFGKSKR